MRFRYTLLVLSLLVMPTTALAQDAMEAERPAADPADVASVDAIITALYDVISGPAGEARDWDRLRSLMLPSARLVPLFKTQDGTVQTLVWTVEDYIQNAGPQLEENGFFEVEAARTTERYGHLVHAFSTYESRHNADDAEPFMRGINSIQLVNKEDRWWIVNVAWQSEWPDLPIPAAYLPGGGE